MRAMDAVHEVTLRRDLPPFRSGDAVRVHVRISEGEKERIQVFEGVVIRRRGAGVGATFTVRKISYGVGVERIFPVESPAVTKVEIKSRGHVRRSRLYYLRELRGKKARLRAKIRDVSGLISDEERDGLGGGTADEIARAAEEAEAAKAAAAAEAKAAAAAEAAASAEPAAEATPEPELDAAEADDAPKQTE